MLGDQRLFSNESEEKREKRTTKKPRRKKHSLEKIIIAYLILSSIALIIWKHTLIEAIYLRYYKGENIAIIDGKIVQTDKLRKKIRYIYINESQSTKDEEMQRHKEENQRRIAELDASINKSMEEWKKAESGNITCWQQQSTGKKLYTNTNAAPAGAGWTRCPK